ncbi:MAG TPA: tyrosine-type recombinase/integrase [Solirubrobacteraceae bacterium]|jgi:integrase|nr:tyrosine-type recombinase/integrase [Solirubrobacteraceae bacterium]
MSVERVKRKSGEVVWRVRWRQGGRNRARVLGNKRDALDFEAEIRRQRRTGTLAQLDAGIETLDEYVVGTWAPAHLPRLAAKTRQDYAATYDRHVSPSLGGLRLRELTPETIARWQASLLAAGGGRVAVRHALSLLGTILESAFRAERITRNPVRLVKKAPRPRRAEIRPLGPETVERMRAAASPRDATLLSVLAYAGLRPGEALALRWGDVRERTLLVERALSLGEEADTKTRRHRTVRLLDPLRRDLAEWRLASGRPADSALVFPSAEGDPWSLAAYQSWRRRTFARAVRAAGLDHARPYDLRHGFASLLLHEGRSVIYVARQLGHDARLTLTRYGHVIDELEDAPRTDAEAAIRAAREAHVPVTYPRALQSQL